MNGVEIDFVVTDSLKALELYETIFDIKRIEVTDFSKGENEVIFEIYGVKFHMLDENPQFHLFAPTAEDPKTMWVNVTVSNIKETYEKAIQSGCVEIQGVTEISELGLSNAIFMDPFNYIWMLHEVHREVSREEMMKFWEEKRDK